MCGILRFLKQMPHVLHMHTREEKVGQQKIVSCGADYSHACTSVTNTLHAVLGKEHQIVLTSSVGIISGILYII